MREPGQQCRAAVIAAGRQAGIPEHVMSAIARVESGRRLANGQFVPWPWSINAAGTDHIFETRTEAISAVRQFQQRGVASIDVGCMQVNLLHHPHAFASLDQAFDPTANAIYAAHFLHDLFSQTGSWAKAIAAYHSATPELGEPYRRRVMQALAEEVRGGAPGGALGAAPGVAPRLGLMAPAGTGAVMLGNHAELARVLPMVAGSSGRGLAAYRARPIRLAGQSR